MERNNTDDNQEKNVNLGDLHRLRSNRVGGNDQAKANNSDQVQGSSLVEQDKREDAENGGTAGSSRSTLANFNKGPSNSGLTASSIFECNICLDTAKEPVVTQCGHLYCWKCIYEWIQQPRETLICPVCKSGISKDNLTPIFTKDNNEDPRAKNNQGGEQQDNEEIPNRPGGQRSEP